MFVIFQLILLSSNKTKCIKILLFRFRTDEKALQFYIPDQCILDKILLNIELKGLLGNLSFFIC